MAGKRDKPSSVRRRDFLAGSVATVGALGASQATGGEQPALATAPSATSAPASEAARRPYNGAYEGDTLRRVAFPMGGMGAGMICLEGTGALSHVSLRHQPDIFNEPCLFAAACVKGSPNVARVLEGPVPGFKLFGLEGSGNGLGERSYGLPRLAKASFLARFPFGTVSLEDPRFPLRVELTGWSPFEPGDADGSSLPVIGLEYRLHNPTRRSLDCVFSFNARNFLAAEKGEQAVRAIPGGFVLWSGAAKDKPWEEASFCARVSDPEVKVNHAWFRGGWFDALTLAWKDIESAACFDRPPVTDGKPAPGASLFVPVTLASEAERTLTVEIAWYVGSSPLRIDGEKEEDPALPRYRPWYSERFGDIQALSDHWRSRYAELREHASRFSACFYDTTMPPEVTEAVAANLTILKSPTVMRQADGRLWCWEGCGSSWGCCHGSCTHVWNYAQAIPHLFPSLERTLRETELQVSQDARGHQAFRTPLPIRPAQHDFHAAADGQLGGIMKVHRDWRLSGDTEWLRRLWPRVKASLDYCISTWDPRHTGTIEEPHHNTYDIEFWGADSMCTSFYLGALRAASLMGAALGDEVPTYAKLYAKGRARMESELWNGEYFIQKIEWRGLSAGRPQDAKSMVGEYSPEALGLLEKEGPKYQYGEGCLSDGVLGAWIAAVCGVGSILDDDKVASHLRAVHRHNLKRDLSEHPNPQRPTFACGKEGGLLLCTWPRGGALTLPFVYSNEVWTGIEYQVASHLMLLGHVEEGLEIVRACRDRYDGRVRNPFDEYECGHFYARAMASYGLLQGLSGVRYDAIDRVLHVEPRVPGDFRSFLATASGYGTVGVRGGQPFVEVRAGIIDVKRIEYHPQA
jgi:uncharacterized protein (DUF608 family)